MTVPDLADRGHVGGVRDVLYRDVERMPVAARQRARKHHAVGRRPLRCPGDSLGQAAEYAEHLIDAGYRENPQD